MSAHYSINLALYLKENLDKLEIDLLNYLINAEGAQPVLLPTHSYFAGRQNIEPFQTMFSGFVAGGEFVSKFWQSNQANTKLSGVNLLLPSVKTPHNWEVLECVDWIASLSDANAFIGTMTDDFPDQSLDLLYVFKNKLFMGKAKNFEITCFSNGEKRTVGYGK